MRYTPWSLALLTALTACSGLTPQVANGRLDGAQAHALAEPSAPFVYVSHSGNAVGVPDVPFVVVFPPNGAARVRRIGSTSTAWAGAIAIDDENQLFVSKGPPYSSVGGSYWIDVYAPGTTHVKRSITYGAELADSLVFDRRDNLYVSYQRPNDYVLEYAKKRSPVRQISTDRLTPGQLATDSKNNVYVEAGDHVFVYGPGTSATPLRTLTHRPNPTEVTGVAIDRSDNVYVAFSYADVVDVYGPGKSAPNRELANVRACALTTDVAGRLYALDCPDAASPTLAVYSPGSTTPQRTISAGLFHPISLAVDRSGYLYVGNYGPSNKKGNYEQPSISVYAPGQTTPFRTITQGLAGPVNIVFGTK